MTLHTISGQFLLLVGLMMVFFATTISIDLYHGEWSGASNLAAASFRDFFLLAIGLFRGMQPDKNDNKE